ncbi:MAG: dihydrofolate reductase [Candidatus Omnitrophota bacterium]
MNRRFKLYHVVATARGRVIGKENRLPWHFPEDLKYFKQLTLGQTVIMGRKTFESIGKPLPGRENFVLSASFAPRVGIRVFHDLDSALLAAKTGKVFIIGGASLYASTLERIDGIYLTTIDADYEGDAFYPEIPAHFRQVSSEVLRVSPRLEALFLANTRA